MILFDGIVVDIYTCLANAAPAAQMLHLIYKKVLIIKSKADNSKTNHALFYII